MKTVILTTDGACVGNPGPGGWACVLRFGESKAEIYGSEPHTTNNRMELRAVIEGLNVLKESCEVTLNIDSQYVKNGITQWMKKWKANGWRTADRKPVLNQQLWLELDAAVCRHRIHWKWVKGHAGHEDNNRCDFLALQAAKKQISSAGVLKV